MVRRRKRKRLAVRCELSEERLREIAKLVWYHGSLEHKAHPSPAGPPALRSDATPCDPKVEWHDINAALAEGVRRGCIGQVMEQGFPRYVWGWIDGQLYEARHLNGNAGSYKGYRIGSPEYPQDREKRLCWNDQ